jgi:hypothetical protein
MGNSGVPASIRAQVENELRRILASRQFKGTGKAAQLLMFVVTRSLDGKIPDQNEIFKEIFPNYNPLNTDVRTTMYRVRSRLERYYAKEGINDPLIISLPKRPSAKKSAGGHSEAYPAVWSHNRRLPEFPAFQIGLKLLAQFTPLSIPLAYEQFTSISFQ